jgi:hypothetical protein
MWAYFGRRSGRRWEAYLPLAEVITRRPVIKIGAIVLNFGSDYGIEFIIF